jgi:hypothetical protein
VVGSVVLPVFQTDDSYFFFFFFLIEKGLHPEPAFIPIPSGKRIPTKTALLSHIIKDSTSSENSDTSLSHRHITCHTSHVIVLSKETLVSSGQSRPVLPVTPEVSLGSLDPLTHGLTTSA